MVLLIEASINTFRITGVIWYLLFGYPLSEECSPSYYPWGSP